MYKTVAKIDGMMCGHCEAHVNDAIRANFDVKKVKSSHEKDETVIEAETTFTAEELDKVLSATGYRVLSVETSEVEDKKGGLFSFLK